MKISTKGRYASRVMLDLAINDTGEPVRLKDIAKRQEISEKYLEQIVSILNRAGYVKSIRGAHGGYILAKKPEEYTIGMILRLTEGSLAPVECLEENAARCDRKTGCATNYVWEKLYDAINGVVDSITIADLVEIERNMKVCDYVI
jgi:Rrf2 family transcriptional regulator, cysteine metabolism repressor